MKRFKSRSWWEYSCFLVTGKILLRQRCLGRWSPGTEQAIGLDQGPPDNLENPPAFLVPLSPSLLAHTLAQGELCCTAGVPELLAQIVHEIKQIQRKNRQTDRARKAAVLL